MPQTGRSRMLTCATFADASWRGEDEDRHSCRSALPSLHPRRAVVRRPPLHPAPRGESSGDRCVQLSAGGQRETVQILQAFGGCWGFSNGFGRQSGETARRHKRLAFCRGKESEICRGTWGRCRGAAHGSPKVGSRSRHPHGRHWAYEGLI